MTSMNPFESPADSTAHLATPSSGGGSGTTTNGRTNGHVSSNQPNGTHAPPGASSPSNGPAGPSSLALDSLSEELPPAYTPIADQRQGEQSVEFGPSRPFQQPPARGQRAWGGGQAAPPTVWHRPATSGWQASWSVGGYPGQNAPARSASVRMPPPPPRHPAMPPSRDLFPSPGSHPPPPSFVPQNFASPPGMYHPPPGPSPMMPPGPASDFARDFYSAGPDDAGLLGGASNQYEASSSSSSSRDPRPTTPPRPGSDSKSGGGHSSSPTRNTQPEIPDDGRPTTTPVPGHPLLNNGKVLVYPAGHECSKCNNTGYKHYDPSHPCSKCWAKYGKPFSGALTYAPWSSTGDVTPSRAGTNLQRPLRAMQPAIAASYPVYQSSLSRSNTSSGGYPGASYSYSPNYLPVAGGGFPMGSQDSSIYAGPSAQYVPQPPPGAIVVQPGDPRIGGRLCWRCNGSGTVSLFFFDQQTCEVCDGAGRILR